MSNIAKHTILQDKSVRDALIQLDKCALDAILFVIDKNNTLIGSLTDGDLRRGFIKGLGFGNSILDFIQVNPSYITKGEFVIDKLEEYKQKYFKIIPILNADKQIVDILSFREQITILPVDAIIMAGGKGERLRPLTDNTPKPLLKVGDKPIIEYNIDRLKQVGIKNITLSINYLGDQLVETFEDGQAKDMNIQYVREDKPLGTIGSILLVKEFKHDDIIVMNSDLLTNIDFKDFYKSFKESKADMAVASTSYSVDVPYAVLEANRDNEVVSLKEKPRYTYYSNAGIYFIKKNILQMIPKDQYYDITDLMERVLEMNLKLITYPINGYWLDIGNYDDYKKAQEDIKHIRF